MVNHNLITNIENCYSNIPQLLYYSHIPVVIVAFGLGLFIFFKSKKSLAGRALFLVSVFFSLWVILDFVAWVNPDSRILMFVCTFFGILTLLIYFFSFYFFYSFVNKSDLRFKIKAFFGLLFLPIIILSPYYLNTFDLDNCQAVDNIFYVYYYYGLCLVNFLCILFFGFLKYKKENEIFKKEVFYLLVGIEFFLFVFFTSGFLASYLADKGFKYAFDMEQYGLFGMVLFMAVLVYLIVKFKAFNTKVVGTQALVTALVFLIGSQFFFIQNTTNRILTAITLALAAVFGYILVRSVRAEINQREELAILAGSLEKANERLKELDQQKTDFLSIAAHQLRTPMSIMNGYIELIKENAYGKVTDETKEILDNMDESNQRLIKLVDEFLDITRIEQGRTKFDFADHELRDVVDSVVSEFHERAAEHGLKIEWKKPANPIVAKVDDEKIRHVIFNFIDNAIKYSEKGTLRVTLIAEDGGAAIRVHDQGLGFNKTDEHNFFQKFYRGNNVKATNVNGTGLGLFVCRKFIESHKGRIWAHSEGLGHGSEFGFWVPIKNS